MTPRFLKLLLAFAFVTASHAQTSDSTGEFWPEFDFYIKLNEKSRMFAMYTATRPKSLGTYADGQTGIHVEWYAVPGLRKSLIQYIDPSRSKTLMIRAGYLTYRPKNNSGTSMGHMATGEATARAHPRGELLLNNRNRVDFAGWTVTQNTVTGTG